MDKTNFKNIEMDNEKANMYFEIGAKLVILDAPQDLEFGIDFCCWNIGPKFKGIKFIPPGFHFIYFSSVDKNGYMGTRNGFFYHFKQAEVVVKKWNPEIENFFNNDDLEPELAYRIALDIKSFDPFLGTYIISPPDLYKKWKELTRYITPELINRIAPNEGVMDGYFPSNTNTKLEDFEGSMNFTPIDIKRSFPDGAVGEELTKYSIDKSFLLSSLMKSHFKDDQNLLGEIELSFITFLLGQNFTGLEQWKKIIVLICNSNEFINEKPNLFVRFLDSIMFQLRECPHDFFIDIILEHNFLEISLQTLIKNINGHKSMPEVTSRQMSIRLDKLNKLLKDKFDWKLTIDDSDSEEEGEYAPTIVEL